MGDDAGAQAALAREIDTPRSHLSAILAGRRGIGDQFAAKLEAHFNKPAGWMDEETGARWPFSGELYEKVLVLRDEELRKAETVLRAHLGMATESMSAAPNTLQLIHGETKQGAYAAQKGGTSTSEFDLPEKGQHGSEKHQRPARKTGGRHA